ncbi:MAG: HlyD family secretion protein, partial [Asticcacaulis sp.]
KKEEVKAPPSPYAAIANGKVDVEGGIIPVAARRAGIIKQVLVQEGDLVTAGQILARQEDDDPRLAVASARARVQQAEAALSLNRVQIDSARRELSRLESLKDNYVAGQRLDQAKDRLREADAQLANQQAAVTTARAALAEAEYNLEQTVIRAPVDGKIVRRYANPGAGASTLNVSNMFDLEPKTERIVRAEIPEDAIKDVIIGQEVEVMSENEQTKVYVGRVKRIAPVFGARKLQSDDPSERADDRVVEVVVVVDNGDRLLIGQRMLVKFMKPGEKAGIVRAKPKAAPAEGEKPAA